MHFIYIIFRLGNIILIIIEVTQTNMENFLDWSNKQLWFFYFSEDTEI